MELYRKILEMGLIPFFFTLFLFLFCLFMSFKCHKKYSKVLVIFLNIFCVIYSFFFALFLGTSSSPRESRFFGFEDELRAVHEFLRIEDILEPLGLYQVLDAIALLTMLSILPLYLLNKLIFSFFTTKSIIYALIFAYAFLFFITDTLLKN